jgi:hypothetical protein
VAKPKVASVVDDAREQHTLATRLQFTLIADHLHLSACLPACLPWWDQRERTRGETKETERNLRDSGNGCYMYWEWLKLLSRN